MTPNLPRDSTAYVISGTKTFRISSRKILKEFGGNLQNKAKDMRSIYEADDGYKMGQRDQSGAEALIVAFLCRPGRYRDLFKYGIKPHTYVALHLFAEQWMKLFDKEIVLRCLCAQICDLSTTKGWKELETLIKSSDDWEAKRRYYFIAKKVVHASSYGMGPNTFQMAILRESGGTIVLTRHEAELFLAMFHKLFPEIHEWHVEVQLVLRRDKELRNLFGHPRKFTGYIGESMFKDAYAYVPQSTVGMITNIAVVRMQEYIENERKDWHILNNNHDSMLNEFPDSKEEEKEWIIKSAEFLNQRLVSPKGEVFNMKSEAQTGYNWGTYKPGKNERGLKGVKE